MNLILFSYLLGGVYEFNVKWILGKQINITWAQEELNKMSEIILTTIYCTVH